MRSIWLLLILIIFACQETPTEKEVYIESQIAAGITPEGTALTGEPLFPMPEPASSKSKKDSLLAIAKNNYDANSDSLENIIWYGRRTAYLSKYQEAIAIYTKGLEKYPYAAELYRHRGHRYISIRKFDEAIADFEKASQLIDGLPITIEPDGIPNKMNIPLSNLQFNITYHLGLAYYLKGNFEVAERHFKSCLTKNYANNPDLLVAAADWLYMSYRRSGKVAAAEQLLTLIVDGYNIIENDAYYNRLKMYKGQLQPETLLDLENSNADNELNLVTQGYGVANWYYYNGDTEKAKAIFEKITNLNYWSAFGYIAAEADLVRLNK